MVQRLWNLTTNRSCSNSGVRDLTGIVEADRRAHKVDFSARRQIVVPGELAVLDLEIADQRD